MIPVVTNSPLCTKILQIHVLAHNEHTGKKTLQQHVEEPLQHKQAGISNSWCIL